MRWTVAALLAVLLCVPPGAAQEYAEEDFEHTAEDGVRLVATRFTPEGEGPFPAILLTNGWTNRHHTDDERFWSEHYARQGYVVYAYTSRGWGESEGEIGLDGPDEVADARAFVDLIAADPDVLLDGPGDPRVGMVGKSYGGGIQFLAAREDPRIDAIVPTTTWSDLLRSLAPDDVLKRVWVSLLLGSGVADGHGVYATSNELDPDPEGPDQRLYRWYAEATLFNRPSQEMRDEVGVVRSLHAGQLETPTFLVQGWPDTLFPASEALRTHRLLQDFGVPVRLALTDVGHGGFGYRDDRVQAHVDDWLNTTLRGEAPTLPPYPVLRHRYSDGALLGEMQWPPAGTQNLLYHLHAAGDDGLQATPPTDTVQTDLVAPPVPADCTEVSQFQAQSSEHCPFGAPGTVATWSTAPLDADTEVTGGPVLALDLESTQEDVMLFAHLVDLGPDGTETPVLHQVTPIRDEPSRHARVVELETVSHTFPAGHRIGLRVATTDAAFAHSHYPGVVSLRSGGDAVSILALPVVPQDAHGDRTPPTLRIAAAEPPRPGHPLNLTVVATDDLAVGPVSVTADVNVTHVATEGILHRYTTETLPQNRTGMQAVLDGITATATDLAGNEATTTLAASAPEPDPTGDDPPTKKKSPSVGAVALVAAVGAAFAVRRR